MQSKNQNTGVLTNPKEKKYIASGIFGVIFAAGGLFQIGRLLYYFFLNYRLFSGRYPRMDGDSFGVEMILYSFELTAYGVIGFIFLWWMKSLKFHPKLRTALKILCIIAVTNLVWGYIIDSLTREIISKSKY